MQHKYRHLFIHAATSWLCLTLLAPVALAQSDGQLEEQIQDRSERIQELEEEINQYESELETTRDQQETLQQAVNSLDSTVQRITRTARQTQQEITATQRRIQELAASIAEIEAGIADNKQSIARTVKLLQRSGQKTLVETLLSADSLADAWGQMDQLTRIQDKVQSQLASLREQRQILQRQREAAAQRQAELADLQDQYTDQRAIVQQQKQEKAELLAATNQEASQYQQLIAEKKRQKEQFEAELRQFEERLNSSASGAAVPEGASQFRWPVTPVRITQQFGGTEFAKRNPAAYGRPFHNGTDFGVPVGTKVGAVMAGTVRATGNTDAVSGCYSYGKWVLVDHNNGLSTLYAHLSRISSSPGQAVTAGERIGYSGNTGYSTGPHLHLTTYVRPDVQVVPLGEVKQQTNCANAEIPVAPLDSYLNSMDYLPSL